MSDELRAIDGVLASLAKRVVAEAARSATGEKAGGSEAGSASQASVEGCPERAPHLAEAGSDECPQEPAETPPRAPRLTGGRSRGRRLESESAAQNGRQHGKAAADADHKTDSTRSRADTFAEAEAAENNGVADPRTAHDTAKTDAEADKAATEAVAEETRAGEQADATADQETSQAEAEEDRVLTAAESMVAAAIKHAQARVAVAIRAANEAIQKAKSETPSPSAGEGGGEGALPFVAEVPSFTPLPGAPLAADYTPAADDGYYSSLTVSGGSATAGSTAWHLGAPSPGGLANWSLTGGQEFSTGFGLTLWAGVAAAKWQSGAARWQTDNADFTLHALVAAEKVVVIGFIVVATGGAAAPIIGADAVFLIGTAALSHSIGEAAGNRYESGQTFGQSLGGGVLDVGGLSGIHTGATDHDIITGQELGLTAAQRGDVFGAGSGTVIVIATGPKVFRGGQMVGGKLATVPYRIVPPLSSSEAFLLNQSSAELMGLGRTPVLLGTSEANLAGLAYQSQMATTGKYSALYQIARIAALEAWSRGQVW